MFYTYILRSISQPEQRYIGSTADLKASLAIRRFFLLAKISGVQRSGLTSEKTNVQKPGEVLSGGGAALFLQFGCNFPKYHAFSLPLFELFGALGNSQIFCKDPGGTGVPQFGFLPFMLLNCKK